jgi:hypothetical protein
MPRSAAANFSRNVLAGAGLGAALAGLFLLVGVLRAALAVALGGSFAALTGSDVRILVFYVVGFTLAGAFVGALRPLLHRRAAIYAALSAAGVIVMYTLAIADEGLAGMDRSDWIAMTVMGSLFGSALAWGFLRRGGSGD